MRRVVGERQIRSPIKCPTFWISTFPGYHLTRRPDFLFVRILYRRCCDFIGSHGGRWRLDALLATVWNSSGGSGLLVPFVTVSQTFSPSTCPHCYGEKWNLNCAHWALPPFPGDLLGSLLVHSHIAYNLRRLPTGALQRMTHRVGLLGNKYLFVFNDLQSVGGLMRVYGIFEG